MRELRDVLNEGFSLHASALGGPGVDGAFVARAVATAKRRRTVRVVATGGVSVATVGAVAVAAVALPGRSGETPGATATSSSASAAPALPYQWALDDPEALGPCESYIPANAAVLPDGMYEGRAYVDPAAGFVVAVMPDGTATRVQPGPEGEYLFDFGDGPEPLMYPTEYPVVLDFVTGGGGGAIWVDANPVGWGWTAEPLAPSPAGVKVASLQKTFAGTFGLPGQGYDPSAIPAGASAQVVLFYADGSEVTGALVRDASGPTPEDIEMEGLTGAALRVTLADGSTWEIKATYDAADVPVLPCQPLPPSGAVEEAVEQPVEAAAPLSGPEASVFACAAPLPADLRDTAEVRARTASGEVALDPTLLYDVGVDGLAVEGVRPIWAVPPESLDNTHVAPGWSSSGGGTDDGTMVGVVHFIEPVAVRDGAIVAAAGEPTADWTAGGVGGTQSTWFGTDVDAGTEGFAAAFNSVHSLLIPCAGETADLADAELALLYGFGPDPDHMTYGWTPVTTG